MIFKSIWLIRNEIVSNKNKKMMIKMEKIKEDRFIILIIKIIMDLRDL